MNSPFSDIQCSADNFESMVESVLAFYQGIKICCPNLLPGTKLFRSRIYDKPIENVSELAPPPKETVWKNGRLNLSDQRVGYFSFSHRTAVYEVNPTVGDILYLTSWGLNKEIYISHVGYAKKQFDKWGAKKSHQRYKWVIDTLELNEQDANKYKILSDIVTGDCAPYLKSNAVGKVLMSGDFHAGLVYPSIATKANADNIALKETYLDSVSLNWIEAMRITKIDDQEVSYSRIKWSDTWDNKGFISWKKAEELKKEGGQSLLYI